MFADIKNFYIGDSIEVLGPKTDLEIKNCDIKLPKASGFKVENSDLEQNRGRGSSPNHRHHQAFAVPKFHRNSPIFQEDTTHPPLPNRARI